MLKFKQSFLVILKLAIIIELQGEVLLKRASWDNFTKHVGVGEKLGYGDLIMPSPEAKLIILCDDNTVVRVPSGRISSISSLCPSKILILVK